MKLITSLFLYIFTIKTVSLLFYSQLTSLSPGSAKHFLIKTVDKSGEDSLIEDKEGTDYSSGGGMIPGGWHSPPDPCSGGGFGGGPLSRLSNRCGGRGCATVGGGGGWGGGVAWGGRRKRSPCGGGGGWGGGKPLH